MCSTDTLIVAVGATLPQNQRQGLLPIYYASRKLNSTEQHYSTEDREFLLIVFSIVEWQHYQVGGPKKAVCLTDREPLKYLYSKRDLNKQQSRWIEKIVDVNPIIKWLPGKDQVVPDVLSHMPDYAKCSSLIVELSFLGNISKCTFDPLDTEMSGLVAAASQTNTNFRII